MIDLNPSHIGCTTGIRPQDTSEGAATAAPAAAAAAATIAVAALAIGSQCARCSMHVPPQTNWSDKKTTNYLFRIFSLSRVPLKPLLKN